MSLWTNSQEGMQHEMRHATQGATQAQQGMTFVITLVCEFLLSPTIG
jgi:hypothetical protein